MTIRFGFAVRGVVLAGTAVLVGMSIVLLEGGDDSRPAGSGAERVGGPLLMANRDRLAFCVEAVEFDSEGLVVDGDAGLERFARFRIEQALSRVAKYESWAARGLDALPPPAVDAGCPSSPALFVPGAKPAFAGKYSLTSHPVRFVEEASYYRVLVFILPRDKLSEVFADKYPVTVEEWMHPGHQPQSVTRGLYLSREQVDDMEYLVDWLTVAAGLESSSSLEIPEY